MKRFELRLDDDLHEQLKEVATKERRTIHGHILRILDENEVVRLSTALDGAIDDLRYFAQTSHQAQHDDHSGTWLTCGRGTCPGVRRALDRALEATAVSAIAIRKLASVEGVK